MSKKKNSDKDYKQGFKYIWNENDERLSQVVLRMSCFVVT